MRYRISAIRQSVLRPLLEGMFPTNDKDRVSHLPELVAQALLMPVRLHAFAALVFGNFCFPSFFKRAHSDFSNCDSIQSSNSPQCKCSRQILGYLGFL